MIEANEEKILEALKLDLGKSSTESYMCEVGLALSEISYMIRHTRSFAKEKRVRTPLAQYVSRSFVKPSPYGVVLIMSPWNYPFFIDDRSIGRCDCRRKHRDLKAKRLFGTYQCHLRTPDP